MRYFAPSELTCRCGKATCPAPKAVTPALAERLDALRGDLGRPVFVNSGLRCPEWNAQQGGVPGSEHETGEGADLRCAGSRDRFDLVVHALRCRCCRCPTPQPRFERLGIAKTFVHVGVSRDHLTPAIWLY